MKKISALVLSLLFTAMFIAPPVFAAVTIKSSGTNLGPVEYINCQTGTTVTVSGNEATVISGPSAVITGGTIAGVTINSSTIGATAPSTVAATTITGSTSVSSPTILATTITLTTPNIGSVNLPINSFLSSADSSPITTSTAPGLEIDNILPDINWADNETTPVLVTFKVPGDYLSGGAFQLFCDSSNSTTPEQVDFDVYINGHGTAWDSSVTGQTPVAVSTGAGTPCIVTLTPATDFTSLAAETVVTLRLWRDNVSDGTGDLEVYYCEFYYNRK